MSEGVICICETCREAVDRDSTDVVRLMRWEKVETFGPNIQWIEGLGHFFHRRHAPRESAEWHQPSN